MDGDQPTGLPIAAAAQRLGISDNALRKRIRRGSVAAAKGADDRWYIFLPDAADQATDRATGQAAAGSPGQGADLAPLVSALQDEVGWLREQLAHKDGAILSLAARVADLADRVPALPPGQGAPVAHGGAADAAAGAGARVPWWQRWGR